MNIEVCENLVREIFALGTDVAAIEAMIEDAYAPYPDEVEAVLTIITETARCMKAVGWVLLPDETEED